MFGTLILTPSFITCDILPNASDYSRIKDSKKKLFYTREKRI